jgi:hypothetical protein
MTLTRDDEIRRLLIHYHEALALAQELALKLLDVVQVDGGPVSADTAREHRRFVGETLARIESNDAHAARLWEVFGVERRKASADAPRSPTVPHDRRRPR